MDNAASLIGLCAAEEVPEGTALKVEHDNLVLAVFNLGGRFFVTDDACTHGPGSLSEGDIDGEIVECNFHQGAFHIPTGRVEAPPAWWRCALITCRWSMERSASRRPAPRSDSRRA